VPLYEYRCVDCDDVFEARRPMAEADSAIACPTGHTEVRRLLSVFATSGSASPGPSAAPAPSGGGGCGGHCACH
jgi:putative FmdB family regulatory protein